MRNSTLKGKKDFACLVETNLYKGGVHSKNDPKKRNDDPKGQGSESA